MSYIYTFVRSIVIYTIIATVCSNVMPEGNYKKYLKSAIGLIFIAVLLRPITDITGLDVVFIKEYLENELDVSRMMGDDYVIMDRDEYLEKLDGGYEESTKSNIKAYLNSYDYKVENVEVLVEEGNIEQIDLVINSEGLENLDENIIKSLIVEVYNLDFDNINVDIRGYENGKEGQ